MDSYIQNMSRDSEWTDAAALATAEGLAPIRITSQPYVQAVAGSTKQFVLDLLMISIIVQRQVS